MPLGQPLQHHLGRILPWPLPACSAGWRRPLPSECMACSESNTEDGWLLEWWVLGWNHVGVHIPASYAPPSSRTPQPLSQDTRFEAGPPNLDPKHSENPTVSEPCRTSLSVAVLASIPVIAISLSLLLPHELCYNEVPNVFPWVWCTTIWEWCKAVKPSTTPSV